MNAIRLRFYSKDYVTEEERTHSAQTGNYSWVLSINSLCLLYFVAEWILTVDKPSLLVNSR